MTVTLYNTHILGIVHCKYKLLLIRLMKSTHFYQSMYTYVISQVKKVKENNCIEIYILVHHPTKMQISVLSIMQLCMHNEGRNIHSTENHRCDVSC